MKIKHNILYNVSQMFLFKNRTPKLKNDETNDIKNDETNDIKNDIKNDIIHKDILDFDILLVVYIHNLNMNILIHPWMNGL